MSCCIAATIKKLVAAGHEDLANDFLAALDDEELEADYFQKLNKEVPEMDRLDLKKKVLDRRGKKFMWKKKAFSAVNRMDLKRFLANPDLKVEDADVKEILLVCPKGYMLGLKVLSVEVYDEKGKQEYDSSDYLNEDWYKEFDHPNLRKIVEDALKKKKVKIEGDKVSFETTDSARVWKQENGHRYEEDIDLDIVLKTKALGFYDQDAKLHPRIIEESSLVLGKWFDPNSTKNEGRHRLIDPKEFDPNTFRRWHRWKSLGELPNGISLVGGLHVSSGKPLPQTVRFSKELWPEKRAKSWWEQNKKHFFVTWKPGDWK